MKLEVFTLADFKDANAGRRLWEGRVQAITEQRARAQTHNPRALETDVALVVAFDNERVVAYQGILPDRFYIDGEEHRVGWLTTWWVDPKKASTGAGALVLFRSIKEYGQVIAVREMSAQASAVFRRLKPMTILEEAPGLTAFIRLSTHDVLPRVLLRNRWLRPLLRGLDAVGNLAVDRRLRNWRGRSLLDEGVTVRHVGAVDYEVERFIQRCNGNELTRRGRVELNWLIEHHWVLTAPDASAAEGRYYFSSVAKRFGFVNVKILDRRRRLLGFLILRIRDEDLAVPYAAFDSEHAGLVLKVIASEAIREKAATITLYNRRLLDQLPALRLPILYRRDHVRTMAVAGGLKGIDPERMHLQDGDGDCAFT